MICLVFTFFNLWFILSSWSGFQYSFPHDKICKITYTFHLFPRKTHPTTFHVPFPIRIGWFLNLLYIWLLEFVLTPSQEFLLKKFSLYCAESFFFLVYSSILEEHISQGLPEKVCLGVCMRLCKSGIRFILASCSLMLKIIFFQNLSFLKIRTFLQISGNSWQLFLVFIYTVSVGRAPSFLLFFSPPFFPSSLPSIFIPFFSLFLPLYLQYYLLLWKLKLVLKNKPIWRRGKRPGHINLHLYLKKYF